MEENKKVEKELSRRQFFKELGYMAGGAMLLSMPWLKSQTPEKLEEVKGEKARVALIGCGSRGQSTIVK